MPPIPLTIPSANSALPLVDVAQSGSVLSANGCLMATVIVTGVVCERKRESSDGGASDAHVGGVVDVDVGVEVDVNATCLVQCH